ncbi:MULTISPECIES: ferritin-like domain-containing protein [Kitasatospora]|uniref:Ferritin-like domain-containing protein n=1 Tax=Kitasatospora cystarginea TaxID=58350 RepID=A0ABP5QV94_9ACTN
MSTDGFADWVAEFEAEKERRARAGDPDWSQGATLPAAVWRSLQRFQVGEDGDGRNLISKADQAGDDTYATAVRLFVAEEQNHGRQLARLLAAGGVATLEGHWSDRIFVRFRRLLGMRLELMVLMIAELVAVEYYRTVRDRVADPLTREVTARILADERRHIPFHCRRLRHSIEELPAALRPVAILGWRLLLLAATLFVILDHGPALHALQVRRTRFLAGVMRSSTSVAAAMLGRHQARTAGAASRHPLSA